MSYTFRDPSKIRDDVNYRKIKHFVEGVWENILNREDKFYPNYFTPEALAFSKKLQEDLHEFEHWMYENPNYFLDILNLKNDDERFETVLKFIKIGK